MGAPGHVPSLLCQNPARRTLVERLLYNDLTDLLFHQYYARHKKVVSL